MVAVADVCVIGGGIVGLATAHELVVNRGHKVVLLEKEAAWAAHQTGHNSGVIHAGLYYKPGSLKARMCVAGNRSMVDFAREHGIPHQVNGKLVVAVGGEEIGPLTVLAERAEANGVPARMITAAEAREHEPEVQCVAALRVESTGIIDYRAVCQVLADRLVDNGAELWGASPALAVRENSSAIEVATQRGVVRAKVLVNCAGLHADRVARLAGRRPQARIVPFRGEYYELVPQARNLVNGLIYPVPDPAFPFLGVHLTRMIDGSVHAGPNAVLALRREGYRWRDISPTDLADTLTFPGTWKLARKYARTGLREVVRSLSKQRFADSLARLVPRVTADDLTPAEAGVRAQAMLPDGSLVDDFLFDLADRQVHVLNAPSPAATSSLEIGRHVADRVTEQLR